MGILKEELGLNTIFLECNFYITQIYEAYTVLSGLQSLWDTKQMEVINDIDRVYSPHVIGMGYI